MKEIRSEVAGVRGGSGGEGTSPPTAEECSGTPYARPRKRRGNRVTKVLVPTLALCADRASHSGQCTRSFLTVSLSMERFTSAPP